MKISVSNIITVLETPNIDMATHKDIFIWRQEINKSLGLPKNSRIPVNQQAQYFWYNKSLYKRVLVNNYYAEQQFFYLDKGYPGETCEVRNFRRNEENHIHVICQCLNIEFTLRINIGHIYAKCNICNREERIII